MSFISTLSFLIGGVIVITIVYIPFLMFIWWWQKRKIKRKINKFFDSINNEVLVVRDAAESELNGMIKEC